MKTISFVIPLYNEEKRIHKTFEALSKLQIHCGLKLEKIIFVNDGSTDKTKEIIEDFRKCHSDIKVISYDKNKGKGYAVKQGMLEADSDYTLFFDADISTPLKELEKFVPVMEENVEVIVGTRKNGKSTVVIHQPFLRELLGKAFTLITQKTLNLEISDFTCGFKAFSKQAKEEIFDKTKINSWGYDAEILFLAKKLNFKIKEVPVIWSDVKGSKVKLSIAVPQTLFDLLEINLRHSVPSIYLPFAFAKKALSQLL